MLRRTFIAICWLAFATVPARAGYPARESWLPVAGHVTGFARGFFTTIYITDVSGATNEVTLTFFAEAQPDLAPRSMTLTLNKMQTAAIDLDAQLTGDNGAIGSLRIRSKGDVTAQARIFSRASNASPASEVSSALNAIPVQFAIGTGESTTLPIPAGTRYKLYAAETHGFPLYFSIKTMPEGVTTGERRLYLSANEQRSWDLAQLFPGAQASALRITGVNGSGKIVAAGTSIASESQDSTVFEMLLPVEARHRIRWPELTAYTAIAFAIALSAIYSMKKR